MKPAARFEVGTIHLMAKGNLKVERYFEENEILMVVYTLNEKPREYTNKYVNMISNIYKWQKANGLTEANSVEEFAELKLVRPLKFGLEMELISPISRYKLIALLEAEGIKIENPRRTHEVVNGWKLVHDGSIRTTAKRPHGFELVSPPSSTFEDLEKICEVLKTHKITTNKSCGIHVHHEIKELKRQQIMRVYEFYNKYESVIDGMLPQERRANSYCRPINRIIDNVRNCTTKSQLLRDIGGSNSSSYYDHSRYYKINLRSFIYYGTIEFRQHNGSIDFEEIQDWILFTHKIVDRAIQINDNVQPFESNLSIEKKFEAMLVELKSENTKLAHNMKAKLKKQRAKDSRSTNRMFLAC